VATTSDLAETMTQKGYRFLVTLFSCAETVCCMFPLEIAVISTGRHEKPLALLICMRRWQTFLCTAMRLAGWEQQGMNISSTPNMKLCWRPKVIRWFNL